MVRTLIAVGLMAALCLAAMPTTCPTFTTQPPAAAPEPAGPAPTADLATLARTDPVGLLDAARRRFRAEVRTYRVKLHKQERIDGTLHPPEVVRVVAREEPFAILMRWESGQRAVLGTPVEGTLFAAGANGGKMTVWRPAARLAFLQTIDVGPTDTSARSAARYAISEGGLGHAVERTYRAWLEAAREGTLKAEYLGTRAVPEVGGAVCHVVRRTGSPHLDPFLMSETAADPARHPSDAVTTITVMIDVTTAAQVGAELRRADGELVGAYYWRDLELNPSLPADQFTRAALTR
jgi:hypothetical protein